MAVEFFVAVEELERHPQVVEADRDVGMLVAEEPPRRLEHLAEEPLGGLRLALVAQRRGQVVEADRHVQVHLAELIAADVERVVTEQGVLDLESLMVEALRGLEVALGEAHLPHLQQAAGHLLVLLPQRHQAVLESLLGELQGAAVEPQVAVHPHPPHVLINMALSSSSPESSPRICSEPRSRISRAVTWLPRASPGSEISNRSTRKPETCSARAVWASASVR